MAKKSMMDYAKGWKSPEMKREAKSDGMMEKGPPGEGSAKAKKAGNDREKMVAKKVASKAPPNTTGMGKNSAASKGASADGWTSKKSMKMPKGGGK